MGSADFCIGIDDRELNLLLICIQLYKEIIDLIYYLIRAGIGPINLVNH